MFARQRPYSFLLRFTRSDEAATRNFCRGIDEPRRRAKALPTPPYSSNHQIQAPGQMSQFLPREVPGRPHSPLARDLLTATSTGSVPPPALLSPASVPRRPAGQRWAMEFAARTATIAGDERFESVAMDCGRAGARGSSAGDSDPPGSGEGTGRAARGDRAT